MTVWQLCLCAGLVFLILELCLPLTFFLSMAIGAFICAVIAVWFVSKTVLIIVFALASLLSLLAFKPFLAKNQKTSKVQETGICGKYIGKIAKVTTKVTSDSGSVTIYGERWDARAFDENDVFNEGEEVEIVKNDSLTMYVKKK